MKFTVEIEEFYLDEEQDIEPTLKNFVIKSVVQSIQKSLESKIEDAITKEVRNQISKSLFRNIQIVVKKVITEGKIKPRHSGEVPVTIEEYIRQDFEYNSGYSSPKETIEKLAKQFGDEMKRRYDLLFASQIVAKLGANGLLKDEAVKMLLETIDKK
jgi:Iap family predicted aminopeptidase